MNNLNYLIILIFSLLASTQNTCVAGTSISSTSQQKDTLPNILLIMADDMGFSDIGCYGSEIPTPSIDALAQEGMRFTQFYNTGRCCPSRASLMTGCYAHAVGMGWMNSKDLKQSGYTGRLSDQAFTIAEALKIADYQTYMVGKWHLSPTDSVKAKAMDGSWPTQRGFDEFYGTMEGAKDYFNPSYLYRNETPQKSSENYYYTHAVSDSAVAFINRHPKENPFFLYTAFYTPHFPLHAPNKTIQKYKGKYKQDWQNIRVQRFQKQKQLGILAKNTELAKVEEDLLNWESLSPEKQVEMDMRMAIYAAQIEELDKAVGKIITALKQSGEYDNTFIVFLSDNGAVGGPLFGKGKKENLNRSGPYTSYGRAWGHVSNTPYQKYKSFCHEGGIITPLIVANKKFINKGSVNRQPTHIIDLMPTILEIAKVELPKDKNGQERIATDGQSLLPLLKQTNQRIEDRPLFWEHEGKRAVRSKNWKLVAEKISAYWELYDLSKDPTETENLAQQRPEKVKELEALWDTWASNHQVLPLDGRSWNQRLKGK